MPTLLPTITPEILRSVREFYSRPVEALNRFYDLIRRHPPSERPSLPMPAADMDIQHYPLQYRVRPEDLIIGDPRRLINRLTLHYSAGQFNPQTGQRDFTVDSIWGFHAGTRSYNGVPPRGWDAEAYHFFFDQDGRVSHGRPIWVDGAANGVALKDPHGGPTVFRNKNEISLHALLANGEQPSRALLESLTKVTNRLQAAFDNKLLIVGHHITRDTACPGCAMDYPTLFGLDKEGLPRGVGSIEAAMKNHADFAAAHPQYSGDYPYPAPQIGRNDPRGGDEYTAVGRMLDERPPKLATKPDLLLEPIAVRPTPVARTAMETNSNRITLGSIQEAIAGTAEEKAGFAHLEAPAAATRAAATVQEAAATAEATASRGYGPLTRAVEALKKAPRSAGTVAAGVVTAAIVLLTEGALDSKAEVHTPGEKKQPDALTQRLNKAASPGPSANH